MADKTQGGQAGPKTWQQRTGQQQQQQQYKPNGSTPPPGGARARRSSGAAGGLELSGGRAAAARADIVQGLLGAGEMVLLHGKTGAGKSAMLRALAFEIATGGEFCGREVEQSLVLYCSPGAPDLAADFDALAELHKRDLQAATLGLWTGDIADPGAVGDKIESVLGGCDVAVIDPDHGPFQWAEAEALANELRGRFACAVILTGRRGDEYLLNFDATWSAPLPVQADLCVLQIDTARGRRKLRGRLTFRYEADCEATVAMHTPELPTLRPKSMTSELAIIWEALTLRAYEMSGFRFTFDEFKIIVLALGLQLDDIEPKRRHEKIKRWWRWFIDRKILRWDETGRCAVLNPGWRDTQRHADIGAAAEALYEAARRNEARTKPH